MLKDVLENEDGNPRGQNMLDTMKKELKRMKVVENREEPFKTHYQEDTTYYVKNNEGNRSRRDDLNQKNYARPSSCPAFYRTASRNRYVRDNSNFRRDFNRDRSQSVGKFTAAGNNNKQGMRSQSKSQERPKSELFKQVEDLGKAVEKLTKIVESKLVNTQFI